MIHPSRRTALRRRLLAWYDAGHRALPWRGPQDGADPYRVWIAEVMLQQTQVRTATPYYLRFLARFPSLASLAEARESEVLALWSGLGYYARARHLHAAARAALRRHGGLPASLEALRALPGFGPYTAGAVASIAFGIPAPAVDGNVARVLARLFLVTGDPTAVSVRSRLSGLAAELAGAGGVGGRAAGRAALTVVGRAARSSSNERQPEEGQARGRGLGGRGMGGGVDRGGFRRPGDLNQALMDLGATVCGKPVPACDRCPVAGLCAARAAGRVADVPQARRRPARRPLVLACALIRSGEAMLVARRPPGGLFARLLAPPAVEVPPGESARTALVRGLREKGIRCRVGPEIGACERTLTHRALTLRLLECDVAGVFRPPPGYRFVRPAELERVGVPVAFRELLAPPSAARLGLTGEVSSV